LPGIRLYTLLARHFQACFENPAGSRSNSTQTHDVHFIGFSAFWATFTARDMHTLAWPPAVVPSKVCGGLASYSNVTE
jgi:hypothetical protein